MGKIVGIDLGTTNSVVAVWEGGKVTVIPNAEGSRLTPSVVSFTEKGERIVGIQAKRQAITKTETTIYSIKRFMGRRCSEVVEEKKMVPYKIVGAPDELARVKIYDKEYSPPEISALILQNLRESAEAYLGTKITEAVITVPAYFNDSQRQATKDAGRIAGLDVKRIINEPTASALAYGLDKKVNQKVAVYDFGGGTFDISIIEVGDNVVEVLSTNGDTHLGGDDVDQRLMNYVCDEFKREQGIDLRRDVLALQRLKEACERAKCELSTSTETEINLPFITADASGPKHLQMKITRAKLESLCEDLIDRSIPPVKQALADAKLRPEDINEVILVGGATRMPIIQRKVREFFKKEPNKSVNPDEAVAIGAAIQAAVLSQELRDILLLDVTPLSLGVETLGGVFTRLIERNTTIPVSKKEIFTTAADSQTSVEIRVYQGERPMASDNRLLGSFVLDGIPPAPRGIPKIEVSFDIDANGILNVNAKDLATGKAQSIVIKASSGLSEEEVQRMIKDAEKFKEQDVKRKEIAELKNKSDSVIYTTEKMLRDFGEKISADDRKKIEDAINDVKKARDTDDPAAMRRALDALEKATHKIVEQAYTASTQQQPPSNQQKKDKPDDFVDAEFKEK